MIDSSTIVFPGNAVDLIATRSQSLDADLVVVKRPLRETDPVQCVGVYGSLWHPDEESLEMRGGPENLREPSISRYLIAVQAMVKDMDEERGLATHSILSKMVRAMLYRD